MKQKFLIIRLGSIGDIILTSAVIRCLRNKYPEATIDFVVKKAFVETVNSNPNIDNIIVFDTKTNEKQEISRIRKIIREKKYTQIIDLHNNIRSKRISLFNKTKVTTYSKQWFKRWLLINFKINRYNKITPVFLRYFEAVRNLNLSYDNQYTDFFVSKTSENFVRNWLDENKIDIENFVAVAPGAAWKNKQWRKEGYVEVINKLLENNTKNVVLVGGNADKDVCNYILKHTDSRVMSSAGVFSISETSALLSLCKLLICNDTGVMHIAQALKKPILATFGATTKELGFFPIENCSKVAEVDIKCRPCTQKGRNYCPKKHFKCMNEISAEMVIDMANELLK